MRSILLSDLLSLAEFDSLALRDSLGTLPGGEKILGITARSEEVGPGQVFFALKGTAADGHQFVAQSLEKGAILAVGEQQLSPAPKRYLVVPNSRAALAASAAIMNGNPARSLRSFGVTGTSGKTTSAFLMEAILQEAGLNPGLIGTVESRFAGARVEATHTTPDSIELQKLLARMVAASCRSLSMEVSSHALKQSRVHGIDYEGAIFTNLTREHMDYHPDMEDYYSSKALLFKKLLKQQGGVAAVGCVQGEVGSYGVRLARELASNHPGLKVIAFGFSSDLKPLRELKGVLHAALDTLSFDLEGIRGELQIGSDRISIRSPLVARFNAYNIAGAVALAWGAGIPVSAIERGISGMRGVPGRLERVVCDSGRTDIHVLVDYAHKPDALATVLNNFQVSRAAGHRLLLVFGCGGDRDRTKRPVMGKIAEDLADLVYVTSDNPRTEEPRSILAEVLAGMSRQPQAVLPDRREAIHAAIREARPGDVVIIAGKGHEDYQILGTQKIHFDDREVAREALTLVSRNL